MSQHRASVGCTALWAVKMSLSCRLGSGTRQAHSWCNVCRTPVAERSHSAEIRREGQWRGVTDSELQDAATIILTANITLLGFF
jgi:hypothetical protein